MSVPPDRISLLDRAGQHVRWLTPGEADAMVAAGEAVKRVRGTKLLHVQWVAPEMPDPHDYSIRAVRREGELHRADTSDNVRGVWCITRIRGPRRRWEGVIRSVMREAA